MQRRRLDNIIESFLDGAMGVGLLGRVRRPGRSTHLIDPRGLKEYKASGDYAATLAQFGLAEPAEPSPAAAAPPVEAQVESPTDAVGPWYRHFRLVRADGKEVNITIRQRGSEVDRLVEEIQRINQEELPECPLHEAQIQAAEARIQAAVQAQYEAVRPFMEAGLTAHAGEPETARK